MIVMDWLVDKGKSLLHRCFRYSFKYDLGVRHRCSPCPSTLVVVKNTELLSFLGSLLAIGRCCNSAAYLRDIR